MKNTILTVAVITSFAAFGQAKDNFLQQQAYAEVQRVASQIDVVQNNLSDLQSRVARLERGSGDNSLKQEIATLRNEVAELKRRLESQRGEIVKDLTGRISKIQQAQAPAPAPAPKPVVIGPHREYIVKSGDTLSLISEAFGCPVKKIKEMNGLKKDSLRVGQKLMLPKE